MISKDIDIVLEYVDNTDPVWQSVAQRFDIDNPDNNHIGSKIDSRRFRSWDNLIYWFRGVDRFMPFIRTVHLVVSNMEQVPDWLNRSKVDIILHRDIIPEKYLPTFNSTTIEMFIPEIKGLSERFILFNDDMFPVSLMKENDFFDGNKPRYQFEIDNSLRNIFRFQCMRSFRLASEITGNNLGLRGNRYIRQRHSVNPLLRSICLDILEKYGDRIYPSLTRFREPFNYTQYLFSDCNILNNNYSDSILKCRYYSINRLVKIMKCLDEDDTDIICLNDNVGLDGSDDEEYNDDIHDSNNYEYIKKIINDRFQKMFQDKSRFEI